MSRGIAIALGLLASGLAACSGGDSASVQNQGGDIVFEGSSFFFEDPHFGGVANDVRLTSMAFGRLVELFALNDDGVRVNVGSEFVINQAIQSVSGDYELSFNPITGQETLFVNRNIFDPIERAEFEALVRQAGNNLDPIQVRDLDSTEVFSMLPRNAALVMTFDDLLDPSSILSNTVQLLFGDPPIAPSTPFVGRVFASSFYGGRTPNGTFYPTRVVFDTTTSEVEADSSATLQNINTIGLRASLNPSAPNFQLKIPTRQNSSIGLTRILTNLSGSPLTTDGNGPVDFASSTRPVTRAFRSGGSPGVISDPSNGFLRDELPPVIVGATPIEILEDPEQVIDDDGEDSRRFVLPEVQFASTVCGGRPEVGDVIVQAGVFAEVEARGLQPVAGLVTGLQVRLISFPETWPNAAQWEDDGRGGASYEQSFDQGGADATRPQCFIQATPLANGYPEDPGAGIQPNTFFTVRFSEPMDPASLTAFDSVTVTRDSFDPLTPLDSSSFVVGSIQQSGDRRDVTFFPTQGLSHESGEAESYFLRIADIETDAFPPRDLAGNPVESVPEIGLTIDPAAPTSLNGGRVQRFSSLDEAPPVGGEWAGQLLIDQANQKIRPRPMLRSTVVIDSEQPILAQMFYLNMGGVVTPFSPFGSKLQAIWRYVDCSFSITDQQDMNIDIEGLSWAPAGGSVTQDEFNQFEIALAHCRRLPDENINPATAFPRFQNSGLEPSFSQNIQISDRPDVPSQVVVHERGRGYAFDSGDLYQSSTGTALVPFPLNRDIPFADRTYYTWRDARIRSRAQSQNNGGTEPYQYFLARGLPTPPFLGYRPFYNTNEAQTMALPLLMEFRVFPDLSATGQNGWDINIAVNSSARPYFRAFRTGGTNTSGSNVIVDPDNTPSASGGFDPTTAPPGQGTPGRDPVVYLGAIDYLTRVSHAHSIWFESTIPGEPNFTTRVYDEPTIEPTPDAQPNGTELRTEFRGASAWTYLNDEAVWAENILIDPTFPDPAEGSNDNDGDPQDNDPTPGIPDFMVDAFSLDLYGDYYNDADNWNDTRDNPPTPRALNPFIRHNRAQMNPGLNFIGTPGEWYLTVGEIENARFYQVRLTFLSNAETGLSPEVSAFAMTWSQN